MVSSFFSGTEFCKVLSNFGKGRAEKGVPEGPKIFTESLPNGSLVLLPLDKGGRQRTTRVRARKPRRGGTSKKKRHLASRSCLSSPLNLQLERTILRNARCFFLGRIFFFFFKRATSGAPSRAAPHRRPPQTLGGDRPGRTWILIYFGSG